MKIEQTMATITLPADFPYLTLLIRWEKHTHRLHFSHMAATFNHNFGELVLADNQLWLKLFEDPTTNHRELKANAVTLLQKWYAKAIFDVVSSRIATNSENDIKSKLDKVPIMTLDLSSNKIRICTATQLAKCFENYISLHAANSNQQTQSFHSGGCLRHILGYFSFVSQFRRCL